MNDVSGPCELCPYCSPGCDRSPAPCPGQEKVKAAAEEMMAAMLRLKRSKSVNYSISFEEMKEEP